MVRRDETANENDIAAIGRCQWVSKQPWSRYQAGGPTRVPCCQCAFSSAVRNAGVYSPYRIALYLRIGRYRVRAVSRTLCWMLGCDPHSDCTAGHQLMWLGMAC